MALPLYPSLSLSHIHCLSFSPALLTRKGVNTWISFGVKIESLVLSVTLIKVLQNLCNFFAFIGFFSESHILSHYLNFREINFFTNFCFLFHLYFMIGFQINPTFHSLIVSDIDLKDFNRKSYQSLSSPLPEGQVVLE